MASGSEPSRAPTLAHLARDVDGIDAECLSCGYKRELPLAPLLERHGETPFPVFAHKLKCSTCGSRDTEARPAWRDPIRPTGAP